MNDCVWFSIGVCCEKCLCMKYKSMNAFTGRKISEEWETIVDKALEPLAIELATKYDFYKTKD